MSIKTANLTVTGTASLPSTISLGTGSIVRSGAHALTLTTTTTTNATYPAGTVTLAQLGAQSFSGLQTFSAGLTSSGTTTLPATVNYTGVGSIVKAGTGALTLTAGGAYNLTIPATGTVALLGTSNTFTVDQIFSGDIAVNGGDITTTAGTLNIGNPSTTGHRTINIANSAVTSGTTTVSIAAGINNATGTGLNIEIGTSPQVYTSTIKIGPVFSSGGTSTIRIGADWTAASGQSITIGTVSGSTTTLNGVVNIASILTATTTTHTLNIATGATASGNTKTVNIGTGGVAGSTTTISIGATAGTSTVTIDGLLTVTAKTKVYGSYSNVPSAGATLDAGLSNVLISSSATFTVNNLSSGQSISVKVPGASGTTIAITCTGLTNKVPLYHSLQMTSAWSLVNIICIGANAYIVPVHGLDG